MFRNQGGRFETSLEKLLFWLVGGGWGEKETVDEHAVLFVQYEVGFLFLKKSKMFQMMWLELLVIAFHSE